MGLMHWKSKRTAYSFITTILCGVFLIALGIAIEYRIFSGIEKEMIGLVILRVLLGIFVLWLCILNGIGIIHMGLDEKEETKNKRH